MPALGRLFSNLLKCPHAGHSALPGAVNEPEKVKRSPPQPLRPGLWSACRTWCGLCCHGQKQPKFPLILTKCPSCAEPSAPNSHFEASRAKPDGRNSGSLAQVPPLQRCPPLPPAARCGKTAADKPEVEVKIELLSLHAYSWGQFRPSTRELTRLVKLKCCFLKYASESVSEVLGGDQVAWWTFVLTTQINSREAFFSFPVDLIDTDGTRTGPEDAWV